MLFFLLIFVMVFIAVSTPGPEGRLNPPAGEAGQAAEPPRRSGG